MEKVNLIEFINNINNEMMREAEMKANPVSELQMHKILFILYGKFFSKFNRDLFDAGFEAWQYGPVEMDYRKDNIDKFNNIVINNDEEMNYLKRSVKKLVKANPWLLVDFTHDLLCWINNYASEEISKKNT